MLTLELVVGDLMREFGYKLNEVLEMGYFEANRLWLIADEMRARDLKELSQVIDFQHAKEDYRKDFFAFIRTRVTRRTGVLTNVPHEVMQRFKEAFDGARRK